MPSLLLPPTLTEADADAALDALNGAEVDGRMIRVDFADNKPKGERKPRMEAGGRGGGFNRGGRSDEGRRVYVGNLDYGTSDDILFEVRAGKNTSCLLFLGPLVSPAC